MTNKFRNRILSERIVDTAKYRYTLNNEVVNNSNVCVISRIEKKYLDTTRTLGPWEIVEVLHCN